MKLGPHCLLLLLVAVTAPLFSAAPAAQPNIVLIYADDIGYGDLGSYGATKVKTPHLDRLAAEGLRFTNAHSPASVCTPSRYALLTGEYAFRKPGTGIASGIEGLLIDPSQATLPSLLRSAGYATGIVGKWHLGLGKKPTDYNRPLSPGPLELGFDYAWFMPATGDRVPCVWVENREVVGLDPADPISLDYSVKRGDPKSFLMGIPRIGAQTGGKAALWKDDELSLVIAAKSRDFIARQHTAPFFLYVATHNIHVPRAPNARFRGTSDCGVRGDTIVELDWMVGEILAELDQQGLAKNTLILFSSDNGGINDNNGPDKIHGIGNPDATNGHRPNGVLRGTKTTIYEGGTRVPLIARWPARIQPGKTSDALACHVDFLASFAALLGQPSPASARDSENILPALLGESPDARHTLVTQTNTGATVAYREGHWKLITKGPNGNARATNPELYDLSTDLGETTNLANRHPDVVTRLQKALHDSITSSPSFSK